MALTGNRILCSSSTRIPSSLRRPFILPSPPSTTPLPQGIRRNTRFTVVAAKKFVSGKNKRTSSISTKEPVQEEDEFVKVNINISTEDGGGTATIDNTPMPKLPGLETDFWEGPQWDGLGFFVQYMWAFGILFALISSGIAVATYNEGATDFKDTPVYKEAIQSQELLEEPEASNSDVFESNPTEEAPSLE